MENVVKTLETSLSEHAAMIRILQTNGALTANAPLTPSSFMSASASVAGQHAKQLSTPADLLRRPRTPGGGGLAGLSVTHTDLLRGIGGAEPDCREFGMAVADRERCDQHLAVGVHIARTGEALEFALNLLGDATQFS